MEFRVVTICVALVVASLSPARYAGTQAGAAASPHMRVPGEKNSYAGDLSVYPEGFTFRSGVTTGAGDAEYRWRRHAA